jgi:hypothetical protein
MLHNTRNFQRGTFFIDAYEGSAQPVREYQETKHVRIINARYFVREEGLRLAFSSEASLCSRESGVGCGMISSTGEGYG